MDILAYIFFFLSFLLGGIWAVLDLLPFGADGVFPIFQNALDKIGYHSDLFSVSGVLLAILIVYHKTVWRMLAGTYKMIAGIIGGTFKWRKADRYQMMAVYTLVAAVPTVVLMAIDHYAGLTAGLRTNTIFMLVMLALNAGLLYIGSHSLCKNWTILEMKPGHAIKLGLFQAVACILPGLSRSAINLTMARNMGFERKDALEFSFIMSIPALLCKIALEASGLESFAPVMDSGCLISAVVFGIGAILLAKWLIKKDHYGWLGFFCLALIPLILVVGWIGGTYLGA